MPGFEKEIAIASFGSQFIGGKEIDRGIDADDAELLRRSITCERVVIALIARAV
jgi:hypothetical protein